MNKPKQHLSTRIICFALSLLMVMTLVPAAVFTVGAAVPERQIWLYVPAGTYDTVDDAMNAMYQGTQRYDDIAALRQDRTGVKVTEYTHETIDVYPGFADNKLTDEIPSYDVGHTEYSFYGWQKMISVDGVLTGSDEYATYGSTLKLPTGTVVYAAVYLSLPKTYNVSFRQADGTLIPELGDSLMYNAPMDTVKPTPEEEAQYVSPLRGHTFTFWADVMQDLSKPYDPASDYFAESHTMGDEALTLWAHYAPIQLNVTYEIRHPQTGEVISEEAHRVTYGQPMSYDPAQGNDQNMPATPEMEGYTFTGWRDERGNSYGPSTKVDFIEDVKLTATFTPDDGQTFRARVWYENEQGMFVDSGLYVDFLGVTHEEVVLTAHQRDTLLALLPSPEAYVWDHEDSGVIIIPCSDPAVTDPAVINVYFARKTFTLTVNSDGGHLTVNGEADEDGVDAVTVYAGVPLSASGDTLTVIGADGVTYTYTVSRNAYAYAWEQVPTVTPAADCVITVTGTRLNVNVTVEILVGDLCIENEAGEITTYTQQALADLNSAYAAAYERAAARLSEALGHAVSVEELRVSDLADETYKTYEAIVSEELASVDVGYEGSAVNVYAAHTYTRYATLEGLADAGSEIRVELITHKGTPQYAVTYTSVDGTTHTLCEELYILDDDELGFHAAATEAYSVTVDDDGSTVVTLCYDRNLYRFTPSVFFGDGRNATEKFEGIPGVVDWVTCYGAPLQALAQMYIDDAHAALDRYGLGHDGYRLDEFATLYALHCKNTGALCDTYTWPAREYGLVIGEYVIQSYDLTVNYRDSAGNPLSMTFPVTYNTPLSEVLTDEFAKKLAILGYDITGFAYDDAGETLVASADTMPSEAISLWTVYTPKTIDLIFDPAAPDATSPTPTEHLTVTFDAPVGALPETTRPGYVFVGWVYTDAEGQTLTVTEDTRVDAAMLAASEAGKGRLTLTALWIEGPTTFEVRFLYETLEGTYEVDAAATLTNVPGVTGQSALEAVLAAYPDAFDAHSKGGFAQGTRDAATTLANDGSTVYEICYDRITYHITVYANGVPTGDEGYAYGAVLDGQGGTVTSATVSYVYGEDLSGYMEGLTPYAAGYAVHSWAVLDWNTILSVADENHTVTQALAYPIWMTTKALHVIDPTSGAVGITVNGEAYGRVMYHYQNAYLPVGAQITLTSVAPAAVSDDGRLAFLCWVNLRDNTVISREESLTFTVTEEGMACKAVYVWLENHATYHVYLDSRSNGLLWMGEQTFDVLDSATKDAIVAVANRPADNTEDALHFEAAYGFTVIATDETNGIIWYETNHKMKAEI